MLDLIEEYESTADDLCSFITSSLQDSHPKHPFDLDPSKKYQVVIQSWNGRFMRGLKILKDHYRSSSLSLTSKTPQRPCRTHFRLTTKPTRKRSIIS